MREDTKRRFEQAIWRERMRKIGIGAAVAVLIAAFIGMWSLDASVVNTRIPGEVVYVGPLVGTSTQAAQEGLSVDVKLAGGQTVRVMTLKTTDPKVGQHVEITEHRHGTGRVTYTWK
jgi:hypothetical protein